jgi:drug/metabolite transporter (DMT)-like permease
VAALVQTLKKSHKSWLPYLGLGVGVVCLAFSAIFVRWGNAPGVVMAFGRMATAALVLAPFALNRWRQPQARPRLHATGLALLGGVFIALDHATLNTALGMTRVANASLFNNTAPLWVALFAWLAWRERLGLRFWVGLGITLAGTLLVFGSGLLAVLPPQLNGGDVLALLSGLFYALYYLATQRGRSQMDTLSYIWLAVCAASLVLLAGLVLLGEPLGGYPARTYLAMLAAGLLSQVVGYFCVGYALGHLPAAVVAPTMTAQPLLTMLLAIPLASEGLTLLQALGAVTVLAGIYWINRSRR